MSRVTWTRPAEWEDCVVFRHAMGPYIGPEIPLPEYGWMLGARCERCGTIRWSNIDPETGKLIRPSRYKHPKGYLFARDEDRPSVGDLRLHTIRKVKRNKPKPRPVRATWEKQTSSRMISV